MTNSEILVKKVMQEHKKNETNNCEETIEALIKMSNDGMLNVSEEKIRSIGSMQKQERVFRIFILSLVMIMLGMFLGIYGALTPDIKLISFCLSIVAIIIAVIGFFRVVEQ